MPGRPTRHPPESLMVQGMSDALAAGAAIPAAMTGRAQAAPFDHCPTVARRVGKILLPAFRHELPPVGSVTAEPGPVVCKRVRRG